jgi:hypothetical protein
MLSAGSLLMLFRMWSAFREENDPLRHLRFQAACSNVRAVFIHFG